jgi:hypothetical protein
MTAAPAHLTAVEPCARVAEAVTLTPARDLFGHPSVLPALALTRAAEVEAACIAALDEGAEVLFAEVRRLPPELQQSGFAMAYGAADLARQAVRRSGRGAVVGLVRHAEPGQIAGLLAGGVTALVLAEGLEAGEAIAAAEAEAGRVCPVFTLEELEAREMGGGAWRCSGTRLDGLRSALAAPRPWRPAAVRADDDSQTPSSLAAPLGTAA